MNKIMWFYNLEKNIWGDNVNANRYYASVSIVFVALVGAIFAIGNITSINIDEDNLPWVVILLFLPNLAESIFSTNSIKIALLRTLLIGVFTALAAVVGFVGAMVIAIVATLLLLLMAFSMFTSGSTPKLRSPRSYAYDENGSQVNLTDEGGGYARDEYGNRWKNAGGSRWIKDE